MAVFPEAFADADAAADAAGATGTILLLRRSRIRIEMTIITKMIEPITPPTVVVVYALFVSSCAVERLDIPSAQVKLYPRVFCQYEVAGKFECKPAV